VSFFFSFLCAALATHNQKERGGKEKWNCFLEDAAPGQITKYIATAGHERSRARPTLMRGL